MQRSRSRDFTITSPLIEHTLRYERNTVEGKKDGPITPVAARIETNPSETRKSLAK
jgi:hypothetical protein